MAKIDLEKFICSMIESNDYGEFIYGKALKNQGLEYKDGQIVEIVKPLEIKAGQWYICIKDYGFCEHDYLTFEKGKIYKSEKDEELTASDGGKWPFGDAKEYFRPATEDEIPQPKFKAGDWIIADNVSPDYRICRVNKVENGKYVVESIYGCRKYDSFEIFDKDYCLWMTHNLKNGDVIAINDQDPSYFWIGIFKENTGTTFSSHCHYNYGNVEFVTSIPRCTKHSYLANIHPASYEQRNMLFIEMDKAGYMWDSKNLVLQKQFA